MAKGQAYGCRATDMVPPQAQVEDRAKGEGDGMVGGMSLWNWKPGDLLTPGKLPTVEFDCYRCGERTRAPVRHVADAEASHWKDRHDHLLASLNDMLERCTCEHGQDAVRLWMLAELIKVRDSLDDSEAWKRGKQG